MLETALVVFLVVALLVIQWITNVGFTATALSEAGILILLIGILEGIPTGLYYHVVLYRALMPRGLLPAGWWLSPQQYHVHLTPEEGRRVRGWFYLGGIGFLLCLAGGILALWGLLAGPIGSDGLRP